MLEGVRRLPDVHFLAIEEDFPACFLVGPVNQSGQFSAAGPDQSGDAQYLAAVELEAGFMGSRLFRRRPGPFLPNLRSDRSAWIHRGPAEAAEASFREPG